MRTNDFDYYLPPDRIAQHPIEPRHESRLFILDRASKKRTHTTFWSIQEYLEPGDVLVINETKVIPARLFGRKATGGRVEVLLLRRETDTLWEALIGGKKMTAGSRLAVENGPDLTVATVLEGARRMVRFDEPVEPFLTEIGQMPLPPYIHERLDDPNRYQTVFARTPGSAAAPTAGLHFTAELMAALEEKGVQFARITLHVGLDTFAPVTENDPREHVIHSEWCELGSESAEAIRTARKNGRRIVAVGTTSVRTLESAASIAQPGKVVGEYSGATSLFILPGHTFRAVDAMVTNFHLPRSTLLMLVSAFAGREEVLDAYEEAVNLNYRFYSFGDAMLIL